MINGIPEQKPNKPSSLSRLNDLRNSYPIIFNLLLIGITGLIIIWILLIFLDSWTLHGEEQEIPDVRGQNVHIAMGALQKDGLEGIINDSVFDSSSLPGTVVDQNPKPLSKVKSGRSVYLTIVAYTPKMITVPDISNTSLRQGQSMLEGSGFKNIQIRKVPSEYGDLVLSAKCNGRELRPGEKLPVNSVITLEVGTGLDDEDEYLLLNDDTLEAQ